LRTRQDRLNFPVRLSRDLSEHLSGKEGVLRSLSTRERIGTDRPNDLVQRETLNSSVEQPTRRRRNRAALDTEGILHEEPEAALPSVDGSVEEVNDDPLSESAIKARMALLGGPEELDIVAAAEAHLAKTAVKTFTPMEQMELIEEGAVEGVTASNLDLLQIEGTHYEILARAQLDEVDFG
jgi:hypothetical protein